MQAFVKIAIMLASLQGVLALNLGNSMFEPMGCMDPTGRFPDPHHAHTSGCKDVSYRRQRAEGIEEAAGSSLPIQSRAEYDPNAATASCVPANGDTGSKHYEEGEMGVAMTSSERVDAIDSIKEYYWPEKHSSTSSVVYL